MGGRGGSSGLKSQKSESFTTGKNGIRTYTPNEEGRRAFNGLSENSIVLNKQATVLEGKFIPKTMKKGQLWDYLKQRNINEFRVSIEKGAEQRTIKQLADYGYHVIAEHGDNANATQKWHTVTYYVSKKKMQYLGLDLKVKTLYKRGWKG